MYGLPVHGVLAFPCLCDHYGVHARLLLDLAHRGGLRSFPRLDVAFREHPLPCLAASLDEQVLPLPIHGAGHDAACVRERRHARTITGTDCG